MTYAHLILDTNSCQAALAGCKDLFDSLYFTYTITLGIDFAIRQNTTESQDPRFVLTGEPYKKHLQTESFMHWMRQCMIEKKCLNWCQEILSPSGFDQSKLFIDREVLHNRTALLFRNTWNDLSGENDEKEGAKVESTGEVSADASADSIAVEETVAEGDVRR